MEADRLAVLLKWRTGSVAAEIGAGDGRITVAAADRVGVGGRVCATELDVKKLTHLEEIAGKHKNISAVRAAEAETNLPPECCDSIFMPLVYDRVWWPLISMATRSWMPARFMLRTALRRRSWGVSQSGEEI